MIMQEYPVKRTFIKKLPENMVRELKACFGVEPDVIGNHYRVRYGAMTLLDVSLGAEGKSIIITTESDRNADDKVILDTNRKFRAYLDNVTGFSTKERVKRAKTVA